MPEMSYEEKEIVLEKGESALFYSDGLVEAHNSKGFLERRQAEVRRNLL